MSKKKTREIVRTFITEDEMAKITVRASFTRVVAEVQPLSMSVPGIDESMVQMGGPVETTTTHKGVMVEAKIVIGGEEQRLVLGAREFRALAAAVSKVLPEENRDGFYPGTLMMQQDGLD